MIKLVNIFGLFTVVLLSACVPKNQATQAECDPGSVFNAATRQCEQLKIVKSFSLYEGETKNYSIATAELLANPAVSCELLSVGKGIAANCFCSSGGCFIQVSPDSSTAADRISTPPYPNFQGDTDIVFRLSDGVKYSNTVWLNVHVNNIDDPPILNNPPPVIINTTDSSQSDFWKKTIFLDIQEVDGQSIVCNEDEVTSDTHGSMVTLPDSHISMLSLGTTCILTLDYTGTHFDGQETIRFTVRDIVSPTVLSPPVYGEVEVTVPDAGNDPPVITADNLASLNSAISTTGGILEEGSFRLYLPYTEYDSYDTALSCSVELNLDSVGNAGVEKLKFKEGTSCSCVIDYPATTRICFVDLEGVKDQFGATYFKYTINTGDNSVTGSVTSDPILINLPNVNDPPIAAYNTVAYPNTQHDVVGGYRVYFQIDAADNSDDESSETLTYTVAQYPSHGDLYKCTSSTGCSTVESLTVGKTFTPDDNLYFVPQETSSVGGIWAKAQATAANSGIVYTAKRKGEWGNDIQININQVSDISNAANILVSGKTINISVNNSAVNENKTTATQVCDAIAQSDAASALIDADCSGIADPDTTYMVNDSTTLANGVDGVDYFTYDVSDGSLLSYNKGVVYFAGEGIKETVGRNTPYLGQESNTNLPVTYDNLAEKVDTSAHTFQVLMASATELASWSRKKDDSWGKLAQVSTASSDGSFDSSCFTSTTNKCYFRPVDGDTNGRWVAASGSITLASGGPQMVYARRLGEDGNAIKLHIVADASITRTFEKVSVSGSEITVNIATDTTIADFATAIRKHFRANGLILFGTDDNTPVTGDQIVNAGQDIDLTGGENGVAYVHYWYSEPPNTNQLGVLYINLDPNVDGNSATKIFNDAPTLCHYGSAFDHPECGEMGCIGDQSPKDRIVPGQVGMYYYQRDITDAASFGGFCYRSTGLTAADWEIVEDKNLYLGANYGTLGELTFFQQNDNGLTYSVTYVDDTEEGSESVELSDSTITVHIEAGKTTGQKVKTVIDGDPIISELVYTFIHGDATAVVNAGSVVLNKNSGNNYVINEKDKILVKRLRLEEGDGLDILNKIVDQNDNTNVVFQSRCKIANISSSNSTLVQVSNISVLVDGSSVAKDTWFQASNESIDDRELSFEVLPAAGVVGNSFINVTFSCERPSVQNLRDGGITCNGAECDIVQNSIGEQTTNLTDQLEDTVDIVFKVQVNEASVGHNGWKNIMALGPKIDIYGHALDSCPYDITGCSSGECQGDSTPVGVIAADKEGTVFYDKQHFKCYMSTGTGKNDWVNADCSVSYSYDEPECNGDNTDVERCVGSAAPTFAPRKVNSMYYDNSGKNCYRSTDLTATGWKKYRGTGQVFLQWENFTVYPSSLSIDGYNIYRRIPGEQFDYERPINRYSITQNSYLDNIKNSWQAPVPGTIYEYEVRPVINGIPTSAGTSGFQIVSVAVPPPNMAFVSRRIVNKTVCKLMNKDYDVSNFNRCEYHGIGADANGYYDIGHDYLVDRFEQGCPYTIPTRLASDSGCKKANGCIGIGAPNWTARNDIMGMAEIYYDRDSGKCYKGVVGTTTWSAIGSGDLIGIMKYDSDYDADVDDPVAADINSANIFLSKVAHIPPLTGLTQTQANDFCTARSQLTSTMLVGLTGGNKSYKLPNRREQIAYSLWDDANLDDSTITSMEQGLDLSVANSKCNSSAASGLSDTFVDDEIPGVNISYTLPGTKASGIRSFYTGSEITNSCVSRFGVQDVVGNVNEWVQDRLFCPTPYTCEFVTNDGTAESSYSTLSGQDFSGNIVEDPQFFGQWSYSVNDPMLCTDLADPANSVNCYGDSNPNGVVKPGMNGVKYLDRSAKIIYTAATAGDEDSWQAETDSDETTDLSAIKDTVPSALTDDTTLWKSAANSLGDNASDFYIYRFDGKRGPCYDFSGTGSCNGELTAWYLPTPDTLSANKFFVPMGMPAASNIAQNLTSGSDFEQVAADALPMNSSGIPSSKLHNDHIQLYTKQIYLDDDACGSMLTGGGYESGDKAGVYSSQFTTCTDPTDADVDTKPSASAVGFRCIVPIN